MLGAILWIVASVVGGIDEAFSGEADSVLLSLVVIGFVVMFCGPLTFWIILPIVNFFRR